MPGPGYTKKFPHGKSIKNPATYEALKRDNPKMSKGLAAAISNAAFKKSGGKRGVHRRGATATKRPRA